MEAETKLHLSVRGKMYDIICDVVVLTHSTCVGRQKSSFSNHPLEQLQSGYLDLQVYPE
jgi:hypothetical protein